jgi:hypothetical protein
MRAQETTVGAPVLRLTSPSETSTSRVEGYAVAETIMRSAVDAKAGEQPDSGPNGVGRTPAAR